MKKVKTFSSVYCSWPCNCVIFLSFNFYTRYSLKFTWLLLMKGGIFFCSLVSRNCGSKIAWWLIRILREIAILLKREWYQTMHRALLMLHCHGIIGGKFFSEINSNEYFLIKHSLDFFFLILILLLNLKFWLCCKFWYHQFNVDKHEWYPGKKAILTLHVEWWALNWTLPLRNEILEL